MCVWLKKSREASVVSKAREMARDKHRKLAWVKSHRVFKGLSKEIGLRK